MRIRPFITAGQQALRAAGTAVRKPNTREEVLARKALKQLKLLRAENAAFHTKLGEQVSGNEAGLTLAYLSRLIIFISIGFGLGNIRNRLGSLEGKITTIDDHIETIRYPIDHGYKPPFDQRRN